MQQKADMVPKTETVPAYAHAQREVFHARLQWKGMVNCETQYFYHHADTICHPNSSYVTTKLYETSASGY